MKIFASLFLTFLCLQIVAVDAVRFWVKPVNHSFAIGILCWNSESTGLISTGWAFRQAEIARVVIRPNLAECHGEEVFIRVESLQNASIKHQFPLHKQVLSNYDLIAIDMDNRSMRVFRDNAPLNSPTAVSPRQSTASPRQSSASPRQSTASPRQSTASPRQSSASPRQSSASPRLSSRLSADAAPFIPSNLAINDVKKLTVSGASSSSPRSPSSPGISTPKKNKHCRHWKWGECRHGDKCHFVHGKQNQQGHSHSTHNSNEESSATVVGTSDNGKGAATTAEQSPVAPVSSSDSEEEVRFNEDDFPSLKRIAVPTLKSSKDSSAINAEESQQSQAKPSATTTGESTNSQEKPSATAASELQQSADNGDEGEQKSAESSATVAAESPRAWNTLFADVNEDGEQSQSSKVVGSPRLARVSSTSSSKSGRPSKSHGLNSSNTIDVDQLSNASSQAVADETDQKNLSSFHKTGLCRQWLRWKNKLSKEPCKYGKQCKFAHGEQELRVNPFYRKTRLGEFVNMQVPCPSGESCDFAHETSELGPKNKGPQGVQGKSGAKYVAKNQGKPALLPTPTNGNP